MTLNTIALELVPPNIEDGTERALEEARKVLDAAGETGLENRIRHVMIPGMIEEDGDRPVVMKPKMDVLDYWSALSSELPGVRGLCTQVTSFLDGPTLGGRVQALRRAGIEGIAFVGVPRTMSDGQGGGVAPTDALSVFQDEVDHRGVILIPTRDGERGRFEFKCKQGATYGMTQLLYSTAIVDFLTDFAATSEHRPEILLSFGFVPQLESRIGLINWLIQDPGNPAVAAEQEFVRQLAATDLVGRRRLTVELYKRVLDGVAELGFPLSVHLEATYGVNTASFETFAAMLDHWSPDRP